MLWTRDQLKPIDIRPIIREHLKYTNARQVYQQRAKRYRPTVHTPATVAKIKSQTEAYWASPDGEKMKAKLRRDRKAEFENRKAG